MSTDQEFHIELLKQYNQKEMFNRHYFEISKRGTFFSALESGRPDF